MNCIDPRFRATDSLAPGYAGSVGALMCKLMWALCLSAVFWALIYWAVFA